MPFGAFATVFRRSAGTRAALAVKHSAQGFLAVALASRPDHSDIAVVLSPSRLTVELENKGIPVAKKLLYLFTEHRRLQERYRRV